MSLAAMSDTLERPAPAPLRVEFKTELSDFPPLAERWETLNRRLSDHDAPFFQSYAWNHYVAQVRAKLSASDFKLLVATVWRGADLVGVWPLALRRRSGLWIARSLDAPFGQMAGVSFSETAEARSVPKGFSMTTRDCSTRPASANIRTADRAAPGGTLR